MHQGSDALTEVLGNDGATRARLHRECIGAQLGATTVVIDCDRGDDAIWRVQDRDVGVVAGQAGHVGEVEVRAGMRGSQRIGATADALEVGEVDRSLGHHPLTVARIRDRHDG